LGFLGGVSGFVGVEIASGSRRPHEEGEWGSDTILMV
jgi:hypothetical protein